jgi:hypothetical protein
MRRNLDQIPRIVALAHRLRAEAGAGVLYASVLDLYYTDQTRRLWREEFVPVEQIAAELRRELGQPDSQDRGGCAIDWFTDGSVQIRLKSSYASTYRSPRCATCPMYCQEGLYGLKHSVEGWVTPCPTGNTSFGVHLAPDLGTDQARTLLAPWMAELRSTVRVDDSFTTFLHRRGLAPATSAVGGAGG